MSKEKTYICQFTDRCKVAKDYCSHSIPHKHNYMCDRVCQISDNGIPQLHSQKDHDGEKYYCMVYEKFIEEDEFKI